MVLRLPVTENKKIKHSKRAFFSVPKARLHEIPYLRQCTHNNIMFILMLVKFFILV